VGVYRSKEDGVKALSEALLAAVDAAEPGLRSLADDEARRPVLGGGWSSKELIGHLIDSAANNHQRFVRAGLTGMLEFPGYDTDGNVRVQAVQEADWPTLVTLWASYNRYLAHVIAHLPEEKLGAWCRIGNTEPVTLEFLATDYLAHLKHHLGQIGLA
jgi:hypothetical protein